MTDQRMEYSLNSDKAKDKLADAARKIPMNIEEQKNNAVIEFNAGVFGAVIIDSIENMKKSGNLKINDESLICSFEEKHDNMNKNVETVIKFENEERKITVNVYRTKSKILINGKDYQWFMSNFLNEFLTKQIEENYEVIEEINKQILQKPSDKVVEQNESVVQISNNTEREIGYIQINDKLKCDRCPTEFSMEEEFRNHIVAVHEINCNIDEIIQVLACDLCQEQFLTEEDLRSHVPTVHGNVIVTVSSEDNLSPGEQTQDEGPARSNHYTLRPKLSGPTQNVIELEETEDELVCDNCEQTFSEETDLRNHIRLDHEPAMNCKECGINVDKAANSKPPHHLKLSCDKCYNTFHKACTELKTYRSPWKPNQWICKDCRNENSIGKGNDSVDQTIALAEQFNTLNVNANDFNPLGTRPKLPPVMAKQRKSNVITENPEIQILNIRLITYKTSLTQKELDYKKLKESDDIKTKKIVQLETQLKELQRTLVLQDNMLSTSGTSNESLKIHNLGQACSRGSPNEVLHM